MSYLADPTTEQNVSDKSLLLPENSRKGNVQKDVPRGSIANSRVKPRLLTVSYSCAIIVQTWFVFGLTIGYTSPVLSNLEGSGNSSAPLDKTTYQDLFSVSCVYVFMCFVLSPHKWSGHKWSGGTIY